MFILKILLVLITILNLLDAVTHQQIPELRKIESNNSTAQQHPNLNGLWSIAYAKNHQVQFKISISKMNQININQWDPSNNYTRTQHGKIRDELISLMSENDSSIISVGKLITDNQIQWQSFDKSNSQLIGNMNKVNVHTCDPGTLNLKNTKNTTYNLKTGDFAYCIDEINRSKNSQRYSLINDLKNLAGLQMLKNNNSMFRTIELTDSNKLKVSGWNSTNNKTWNADGEVTKDGGHVKMNSGVNGREIVGTVNNLQIDWGGSNWLYLLSI